MCVWVCACTHARANSADVTWQKSGRLWIGHVFNIHNIGFNGFQTWRHWWRRQPTAKIWGIFLNVISSFGLENIAYAVRWRYADFHRPHLKKKTLYTSSVIMWYKLPGNFIPGFENYATVYPKILKFHICQMLMSLSMRCEPDARHSKFHPSQSFYIFRSS